MTTRSSFLGSTSFAHLLGLSAAKPKAEETDDEKKKREDKEREDDAKAETGDEKKDDEAKAKKAEEGDDKPDDQGEDETDEEYRDRKKREQDDKDDDDDDKDAKRKAARGRERARCAAIFGSAHAGTRPDVAAHYAFATNMSSKEAIGALAAVAAGSPKQARSGFRERMEGERSPNLGNAAPAGPSMETADGVAQACLAAAGLLPKK